MLSINTNLSSLIVQGNLQKSTDSLNQAIERMTTGCKINHASDNAANYSISTNINTKIGSYNVAEDNCAMGLDMLTTASGGLNLIHSKLQRLRDLALQSANGTYGLKSQEAINAEANAIVDEVKRVYDTVEYNGKNLFTDTKINNKFIAENHERDTSNMTTMTELVGGTTSATNEYSISTTEELVALANYVNSGKNTTGMTFVLGDDIDLSSISNWTPIGDYSKRFRGVFDGNGHVINNLTINNETQDHQGLFGIAENATIKNVGLENVNVNGRGHVGSLVGLNTRSSTLMNCYATGNVYGVNDYVGGLVGFNEINSIINNCYTIVEVSNLQGKATGGLAGRNHANSIISNCYAAGNVNSYNGPYTAGLVGLNSSTSMLITCYATGDVFSSSSDAGGLVGHVSETSTILNSYATGDVYAERHSIGGCAGSNFSSEIKNSYALGHVSGTQVSIGSFVGNNQTTNGIIDCASLGGIKIENTAESGDILTFEEIQARYTHESMGFTEENGWVIINGTPYLKGMVPAGVVENTSLQIGINSNHNSQIEFNMGFTLENIDSILGIGKYLDRDYISVIDKMLETITAKHAALGAVQNRLESALDSIFISRDNLVSAHSTIRDADMAEVSSQYIQQQILQQASATLLATANQTPALALQLL